MVVNKIVQKYGYFLRFESSEQSWALGIQKSITEICNISFVSRIQMHFHFMLVVITNVHPDFKARGYFYHQPGKAVISYPKAIPQ